MARRSKMKICLGLAALVVVFFLLPNVLFPTVLQSLEQEDPQFHRGKREKGQSRKHSVEIWSLTSAGVYLWLHILKGTLTSSAGGRLSVGEKEFGSWNIRFTHGKGLAPEYIKPDTEYLVLALNGRSEAVRSTLFVWLQQIQALSQLKKVGLLLIGSEECEDRWLLSHLSSLPDIDKKISAVWMTYDYNLVDGRRFYQWPLGVATYRNFPSSSISSESLVHPRPYRCNFLGTVYQGSTRLALPKILEDINVDQRNCFVKIRTEWVAHEKVDSMETYQHALRSSDLTLCPTGKNAESYRIYEAMAMGSVPVLELADPTGTCQSSVANSKLLPAGLSMMSLAEEIAGPYRLLKSLHAPVIYINSWSDLPELIRKENLLSLEQVIGRRRRIVKWYSDFRETLAKAFMHGLDEMVHEERRMGN